MTRTLVVASLSVWLFACGESGSGAPPSATATGSGAMAAGSGRVGPAGSGSAAGLAEPEPKDEVPWVGIPRPVAEVEKVINPKGEKPYAGKTGTLKGKITIKGDPAPKTDVELPPSSECPKAEAAYGTWFRAAADGGVADALVAVTGYEGFVPVKKPAIDVTIQGCAFDQNVYAMTFGQRVEVRNLDGKNSYVPFLDPAPYRAVNVAMPKGNPVRVYAYQPAVNYTLRDFMQRNFMVSRVFALKFSTHDVTDASGRYEITGIPVGKVRVDAFLPTIDADAANKELEIAEGDNTLDLELTFDARKHKLVSTGIDPWKRTPSTSPTASGGFAQPPKEAPPKEAPKLPSKDVTPH